MNLVILTSTTNSVSKIDLSFNVAVIIIIGTALSSVIVSIINNLFQLKMKKQDLQYQKELNDLQLKTKEADINSQNNSKQFDYIVQKTFKEMENEYSLKKYQWETYYKCATEVFTNMLINVGEFIGDTSYVESYQKAISSIHQAYAFADENLRVELELLRFEVAAFNNLSNNKGNQITAMQALERTAISINKIINVTI